MSNLVLDRKETQVEYQEFSWQAIKSLAAKIGVPYYARNDYYQNNYGFEANRFDATKIQITGYVRSSGHNDHDTETINRLAWKCFQQTLELYFLKNNIKYEWIKPNKESRNLFEKAYIRIIK